jgi:phosphotransferase system enzyme I (PtsI)
MEILKGISASKGVAIAPGFIYHSKVVSPLQTNIIDIDQELNNLHSALKVAKEELEVIYQDAIQSVGKKNAEIFYAQLMMIDDPDLISKVEKKICYEYSNAGAAYYISAEGFAQTLEQLPDEYFRVRAIDVRDITARVIRILQHGKSNQQSRLSKPVIILAEDLVPSDTLQFNPEFIVGFYTIYGGVTSHTAILSRSLGVPAVVGGASIPNTLAENEDLILDGDNGLLIVNPDSATLAGHQYRYAKRVRKIESDRKNALKPAITKDDVHIKVVCNIGNINEANVGVANGAEGIGLLRTEFSYIQKGAIPSEEEMVLEYNAIFRKFDSCPIIVRVLDVGGDKEVPYLKLPKEANPFLGCRGIRLCLNRPDLLRPQLRAILRAGADAKLSIMFPMVATIDEVRLARAILCDCMNELESENKLFNSKPQFGIMVEVPAAVVCADQLAKEVDFFSIGTNDLTQYALAADRTNTDLLHLLNSLHPAILRMIKQTIDKAHQEGIEVGICGELASEPLAIPILLGLGVDEFSVNPLSIPHTKEIIRNWDSTNARLLAEQAIYCETPKDVEVLVANWKKTSTN